MITVTENATAEIEKVLTENNEPFLRIAIQGGGCSGFQYKIEMVGASEPDDIAIERDGAKVLIDPVSIAYMDGSEIDYVDTLMGAGFKH